MIFGLKFERIFFHVMANVKLRGSPASGRVPLERRVGPCALSTKRRTQHTKKAVNDKLPLHQINEF